MRRLNTIVRRARDQSGQTMAEYTVMVSIVTVTIVLVVGVLSASVHSAIMRAANLV